MAIQEKNTLVFGRHPVMDALQAGAQFDKIFLQQGVTGDFERELRKRCKENDVPLQYVPKERMNHMVKGTHQGVVGFLALLDYARLDNVVPGIFEAGETPLLLLLDRITDVRNLGAIARSAEVFGAHAIVVPKSGSALINADAIKTSAGALTRLPVCRENSLVTSVEYLQHSGVYVLASDLKAQKQIFDADLKVPVGLILGSEDEGIHPSLLDRVDDRFLIPQKGVTDSLNVSVAAGVMLYEAVRQRMG